MNKLEQAARQLVTNWDSGLTIHDELDALREALSEQAEQEPVCIDWDTKTDEPIMGYAAPVRTKDLTDDEILEAVGITDPQGCIKHSEFIGDARAVIAADREKNK